jgi:sugar lactone lactonase YvrE
MTTTFADQLGFPEAPVVLPDGGFLFVEMNPDRGWVIRFSKDGKSRAVVAKTGRPNGLAPDRDGYVWVAETAMRALLRMSLDGKYEVIANACDGQPFLFLNDLALAPNGDVYLTDSGIEVEDFAPGGQLNPDYRTLPYDGRVFRIDARTRAIECIDPLRVHQRDRLRAGRRPVCRRDTERQHLSLHVPREPSERHPAAVRQRHRAFRSGGVQGAGRNEVRC